MHFLRLVPNVGFEMESYTTTEGSSVMVTVVSNEPVPMDVVEVHIVNLTAKGERSLSDWCEHVTPLLCYAN